MKIFEEIKNEASIQGESVTSLPKILQCLFEAEDLRFALYQASLKIIELKKNGTYYAGIFWESKR